jgi:diguanylate cyclase (GGDEF)-like protein
MLDRKGETATAASLALDVNHWAAEHGERAVQARSHRQLAIVHHSLGDPATCLEHAVSAVELLDEHTDAKLRGFHLIVWADTLAWTGEFEESRERYRAAEQIFTALGEVELRLKVVNNLSYTEFMARQPQQAWEAAERMMAIASTHGLTLYTNYVDTIARAHMGLGHYAEAEQLLQADLRDQPGGYGQSDGAAEILLTLAEAQRCQGKLDSAETALARAWRICDERGLAEVRTRVQQEQAELYAAQGRFADAYALYKRFHADAEALRQVQGEARARTRQALFETAEAREEAKRFREQALRDALTGVYNRRYVDEQLPLLIAHAAQTGSPLSIALVDLDHFKRVNDTFSHDVGDRVLVTVAGLLAGVVTGPASAAPASAAEPASGFVARMGGEEFVIALPDTTPAAAARTLEELRVAIRSYPWRSTTGDLPVTVSIGAATTRTHITQSDLLSQADRNLYAAKRAGRDRVVDPGTPVVAAGERRRYRTRNRRDEGDRSGGPGAGWTHHGSA